MAAEKEGVDAGSDLDGSMTEKSSGKETTKQPLRRTSRGNAGTRASVKTIVTRAKKNASEKQQQQKKETDDKTKEVNKSEAKGSIKEESTKKTSLNGSKSDDKGMEAVVDEGQKSKSDSSTLVPDSTCEEKSDISCKEANDSSALSSDICVDSISETVKSSSVAAVSKKTDPVDEDKGVAICPDVESSSTAKCSALDKTDDSNVDDASAVLSDSGEKPVSPKGVAAKSATKKEGGANNSPSEKETTETRKSGRVVKVTRKSAVTSEQSSPKGSGNDPSKNGSKAATKSSPEKKEKNAAETGQAEKDLGEKVKRISPSDKTLWVSSLSNKTRAADLKALFSKHGKVSTAKILTNSKTPGARCYGLVTMFTSKDALACIKHLHHTELHGRVISVEKTRLALKKQTIISGKSSAKVDDDKTKVEKAAEKVEEKPPAKESKEKESKDAKSPSEKKLDKSESHSTESKVKKDDKKKPGGAKDDKRSPSKTKQSTSKDKKASASKEKEDRSRNRTRSVRNTDTSSRAVTRTSQEKDRVSLDRSKSRNRRAFNRSRSRIRWRSRSPLRTRHTVNRSKSPLFRNRPFRDRYGNVPTQSTIGRVRFGSDLDVFENDREMERRNRQETLRLERERERLRVEREELEREKARVLRLEKEHQRLERQKLEKEMEELRKYSMIFTVAETQGSKRSIEREAVWEDRKRSRMHERSSVSHSMSGIADRERRESRHDGDQVSMSRYYDSSGRRIDRPYHGGSSVDAVDRPPTWNNPVGQDQSKYGVAPVVPGIWARMDVPPPPIPQQRWGGMDTPRVQHPSPMGHQPPPAPIAQPPNQVVMFVGSNPNNNNTMPSQYPSSNHRFNSSNGRRF